jgi:hypothetical protein
MHGGESADQPVVGFRACAAGYDRGAGCNIGWAAAGRQQWQQRAGAGCCAVPRPNAAGRTAAPEPASLRCPRAPAARTQVPPNGLVLYTGTILTDEGKEKKVNIDFEPFKPINTSLYLCDNKFHTEALAELLESDNRCAGAAGGLGRRAWGAGKPQGRGPGRAPLRPGLWASRHGEWSSRAARHFSRQGLQGRALCQAAGATPAALLP